MYLVTNRELDPSRRGLAIFGDTPNHKGPNELRLVEVTRSGKSYRTHVVEDRVDDPAEKIKLGFAPDEDVFGSALVAHRVIDRARKAKRNVLFFVHGFNNDVKAVVERAEVLQRTYGVDVLAFSWPANGGGARGVLDYKSDKRDARASTGALDRVLAKMADYLEFYNEKHRDAAWTAAAAKFPENAEARDAWFARALEANCKFTVNALFHSMGNYLLKQLLKSTSSEGNRLIFDNVVLAAPDTNALDHDLWVDRIKARNRIYIAINERDYALAASRMKAGQEQLARLGHCVHGLDAPSATYVDFTGAARVARSHGYFADDAVKRNERVRGFFQRAFNGQVAETSLRYEIDRNLYRVR
ncbi:hypothetical protein Pla163_00610 [Planctomycetes bacterium Pla163]|uniref:Alpha/beta hydrolase family protein n=1 Tax=Rohdeia mirabilis TaxID=2528008 RepID=A0A518CUR1_9BACT|nr:hypothetical protein Pla163_00610 [Planctomycetes bacterium Pla163]